jgi:RHS repeat-associated protein
VDEEQPAGWAYHLPDALGSVRQLTDSDPEVTLARSYEPFGSVMASSGSGETSYSFTGEWADGTGFVYLRARYYAPGQGRFITKDTWGGNYYSPLTLNQWNYVQANPIIYVDPSGHWCVAGFSFGLGRKCTEEEKQRWATYYNNTAQICKAIGANKEGFAYGFWYEYLDGISVIGLSTITKLIYEQYTCQDVDYSLNHDPAVVAGRYAGRNTLYVLASAEIGLGTSGIATGGGLSLTGVGSVIGVPMASLGAEIAGHGVLVMGHLILKENIVPLPGIYFASSSGGGGSGLSDDEYEQAVRDYSGGKEQVIDNIPYDSVTDDAIIQAKSNASAQNNWRNFLSGDGKNQIKRTISIANGLGLKAEFWFSHHPHKEVVDYEVVDYIVSRGGIVRYWVL